MKKIAAKLVRVMEECSLVKKKGINDFHHYKYATSADVLEKVNAALVRQQLASIVTTEIIDSNDVTNIKGNIEHLVTVKTQITLVDVESGETLQISGIGSGQDGGDKAVMKAQTAGIKYAYMMSLAISTNDDPEADVKTDENVHRATVTSITPLNCSACNSPITAGIQRVSANKYGRALCMKCQKSVGLLTV